MSNVHHFYLSSFPREISASPEAVFEAFLDGPLMPTSSLLSLEKISVSFEAMTLSTF